MAPKTARTRPSRVEDRPEDLGDLGAGLPSLPERSAVPRYRLLFLGMPLGSLSRCVKARIPEEDPRRGGADLKPSIHGARTPREAFSRGYPGLACQPINPATTNSPDSLHGRPFPSPPRRHTRPGHWKGRVVAQRSGVWVRRRAYARRTADRTRTSPRRRRRYSESN